MESLLNGSQCTCRSHETPVQVKDAWKGLQCMCRVLERDATAYFARKDTQENVDRSMGALEKHTHVLDIERMSSWIISTCISVSKGP